MSEFKRDLRVPEDSPKVEIEIGYSDKNVSVTLDWSNTLIRLFKDGASQFDHIIIEVGDDIVAVRTGDDFMEHLINLDFPVRIDPCLDPDAIEAVALFEAVLSEGNNDF